MKSLIQEVGTRLKAVRQKLKLSQTDYSKKLNVSQSFLSFVEKGRRKPSFDLLLSLVLNFRVNLHWVLTGEGEMFIEDEGGKSERVKPVLTDIFPGIPPEPEVIDLVKSLEVPIMRNALIEKYLLYRKRYEDFIIDHYSEKDKKGGEYGSEGA